MTVLTSEQERAVERRGEPLLVAAGAGSGKTSVLVERFVRAVREDGVAPGRILAITFTERAAGELQERVRERLWELGERAAARDTEAAFVTTFHGFCARLLRVHPLMAGLDPQFTILDEGLAGRVRRRAFAVALRDFLAGEHSEAVDLLAAYGVDRVRTIVEGVHAELRSRGRRRPRLPAPSQPAAEVEGVRACALLGELLEGFDRSYEALKRERGTVDFDDLELCARELLEEHGSVRREWSERFQMLMVDEFQDTNPRQLAILKALESGNLFTVGDELQSIYGFRHADVRLFRARRAELAEPQRSPDRAGPADAHGQAELWEAIEATGSADAGERAGGGGSLELARNFRSRAPLLDVVNAVFGARFGARYTPLIASREDAGEEGAHQGGEPLVELLLTDKRGWDAGAAGEDGPPAGGSEQCRPADGPPSARQAHAAGPRWRLAEARMLAERVAELVASGRARAGEVAVLLRAVGDLEVYERALQERGLRTLASVGGFWGRQQVGDLLAYLRALANPLDEQALYATLASPLVGCSSDALALLADAARARGGASVWETLRVGGEDLDARLPAGDRDALGRFRALFEAERRTASLRTISQLIERAIQASGYREHVLGLEWGERRLANVHKLLRLARRFEASEGRDLRGFLDHVAELRAATSGAEPDAPVGGVEPDAVRLMSIHAAKGLEFPVVCVADLGRAQNVSVPDLLVDGDRIGLRLLRLDGGEATPALDFEQLAEERKAAQAEEEERILYVAMTRARERLLLSGAVDFERWPQPRSGAPAISWLGPALVGDLPTIVRAPDEPVCDMAVGVSGGARVRLRLNTPQTAPPAARSEPPRRPAEPVEPVDRSGWPITGAGARLPVDARGRAGAASVGVAGAPEGAAALSDGVTRAPQPGAGVRSDGVARAPQRGAGAGSDGVARAPQRGAGAGSRRRVPLGKLETLSYTTLGELERCGYRYYLERVLGMPENSSAGRDRSAAEGLSARARGTLVHRLLESVDFARPTDPSPKEVSRVARELGLRVGRRERDEVAALVGAAIGRAPCGSSPAGVAAPVEGLARGARVAQGEWEAPGERVAAAEGVAPGEGVTAGPGSATGERVSVGEGVAPGERVAAAGRVSREQPFAFSLGPHEPLITGVIDLLAREADGGWMVLDYKSDRVAVDDDLSELVEREYGIQRLIYALAVLRDGAPEVEIVHWFLQRPHDWVAARYGAGHREGLEARLAERIERARAGGFEVSEHPRRALCLTCPGRAGLCSWGDAETLKEG